MSERRPRDHESVRKSCVRRWLQRKTVRRWVTSIAADNESNCEDVREKQNGPVWLLDGEAELQLMMRVYPRQQRPQRRTQPHGV